MELVRQWRTLLFLLFLTMEVLAGCFFNSSEGCVSDPRFVYCTACNVEWSGGVIKWLVAFCSLSPSLSEQVGRAKAIKRCMLKVQLNELAYLSTPFKLHPQNCQINRKLTFSQLQSTIIWYPLIFWDFPSREDLVKEDMEWLPWLKPPPQIAAAKTRELQQESGDNEMGNMNPINFVRMSHVR